MTLNIYSEMKGYKCNTVQKVKDMEKDMQIRKSSGPNTDPCGIPVDISFKVDT